MKKYYYKHKNGVCKEPCPFGKGGAIAVKIGSVSCLECENNKGLNSKENWVKCQHCKPKSKVSKIYMEFKGKLYESRFESNDSCKGCAFSTENTSCLLGDVREAGCENIHWVLSDSVIIVFGSGEDNKDVVSESSLSFDDKYLQKIVERCDQGHGLDICIEDINSVLLCAKEEDKDILVPDCIQVVESGFLGIVFGSKRVLSYSVFGWVVLNYDAAWNPAKCKLVKCDAADLVDGDLVCYTDDPCDLVCFYDNIAHYGILSDGKLWYVTENGGSVLSDEVSDMTVFYKVERV